MVISLFFANDPPVLRAFHAGAVHSYRIHVESDQTTIPETLDYVLWTRCKAPKNEGDPPTIEFRISNFKVSAGGKSHRESKVGGGTLGLPGSGLPDSLAASLVEADFWYPFLTWYLPPEVKDGAFDASQPLGSGLQFVGKGTLKQGEYDLSGKVADATGNGSAVTLSWKVDTDGWVGSGEGSVVTPQGTVSFKISQK